MKVFSPPEKLDIQDHYSVFLAGSIKSDTAEEWQHTVIHACSDTAITFLNPRRKSWDVHWKQEITNPVFKEQVNWELDALEQANFIIMYFDPATKSPISLLELGLFARSNKIIVCCPEGFWRKGNVDIVCERYGVSQVPSLEALITIIKKNCL